jgi:hypothetical protein
MSSRVLALVEHPVAHREPTEDEKRLAADRAADRATDRQAERAADRQANRQRDGQADRRARRVSSA